MPHSLRTGRLLIRPITLRDAQPLWPQINHPEMTRMTGAWVYPFTADQMRWGWRRYIAGGSRHNQLFAIIAKGGVAGTVFFSPRDVATAEIGYWIGREYAGRGIATEAVNALAIHAFRTLKFQSLEACVFADNPASLRVMEKTGFTLTERMLGWCADRRAHIPDTRHVRRRTP